VEGFWLAILSNREIFCCELDAYDPGHFFPAEREQMEIIDQDLKERVASERALHESTKQPGKFIALVYLSLIL